MKPIVLCRLGAGEVDPLPPHGNEPEPGRVLRKALRLMTHIFRHSHISRQWP